MSLIDIFSRRNTCSLLVNVDGKVVQGTCIGWIPAMEEIRMRPRSMMVLVVAGVLLFVPSFGQAAEKQGNAKPPISP